MINDNPADIEQEWPKHVTRQAARQELENLVGDLEVVQVVWNDLLAPLYDAMAARLVYTRMLRCRSCGRPHPASPTGQTWTAKGREVPGHATHCQHYTGPLEHRPTLYEKALIGYRHVCLCGRSYPDEDGAQCPDTDVDWRGPRP